MIVVCLCFYGIMSLLDRYFVFPHERIGRYVCLIFVVLDPVITHAYTHSF